LNYLALGSKNVQDMTSRLDLFPAERDHR
jgi:hypothetical protein